MVFFEARSQIMKMVTNLCLQNMVFMPVFACFSVFIFMSFLIFTRESSYFVVFLGDFGRFWTFEISSLFQLLYTSEK